MIGPRNLFWRWVQVPAVAAMITAASIHRPWLFLVGIGVFVAGMTMATIVATRYPEQARPQTPARREVGLVLPPVDLIALFGWLVADTRNAVRARRSAGA